MMIVEINLNQKVAQQYSLLKKCYNEYSLPKKSQIVRRTSDGNVKAISTPKLHHFASQLFVYRKYDQVSTLPT